MTNNEERIRKFTPILMLYPVVLIIIGLGINVFIFGHHAPVIALPSSGIISGLIVSGVLLVINHIWLMTATELTRLRFKMYASHEEWAENDVRKKDVVEQGWIELDRHHNAHRNATENSVYFVFLALIFSIVSPPVLAANVWLICFAVGRLGYTFGALRGKSGLRGLFMSLSLLALFGLASYLVLAILA